MKINLHLHSNSSLDGDFGVKELIDKFREEGYDVISITDHNTCNSYYDIEKYSDIKIITGIEVDAVIGDHTYDFLCYDFDLDKVSEWALEKYQSVEVRQKKIFDVLVNLCYEKEINLEDVNSYNPSCEYAHNAIYRMLPKEFLTSYNLMTSGDFYRVSTTSIGFPLYLDMRIVWPDILELIDVIHSNNGKIFLAHPNRYNMDVRMVLDEVRDYVDGIEICNNPKDKDEVLYLYNYAKDNNLLVSCGSDYHGDKRYSMDCQYLSDSMIEDILSWM